MLSATSLLKRITFFALILSTVADEYLDTLLKAIENNKDQCSDIEEFRVIIDEEAGELAPCSWIDDAFNLEEVLFRREAQCRKPYVRLACKRACGTCCGDNAGHTFEFMNSETGIAKDVTCSWLADSSDGKKDQLCPMKMGSCPKACGNCDEAPIEYPTEPTPTPCRDDIYFKITFDAEPGRKESCSWIDDASNVDEVTSRREEVCWRRDVKKACKRACGQCCGDNDFHLFKNTNMETGETKLVGCEWLSNRSEKKKENVCSLERGSCPDACGECSSGIKDPAEVSGSCYDEPEFRLLVDEASGKEEPCSWIDDASNVDEVKFRRKAQCRKQGVRENCKRACGECCGDNDSYTFEYVNSEKGTKKDVDCAWLAKSPEKRRKKLCQTKKGPCPQACGMCATESPPTGTTTEETKSNGGEEESEAKPETSGAGFTTNDAPEYEVFSVATSLLLGAMVLAL